MQRATEGIWLTRRGAHRRHWFPAGAHVALCGLAAPFDPRDWIPASTYTQPCTRCTRRLETP